MADGDRLRALRLMAEAEWEGDLDAMPAYTDEFLESMNGAELDALLAEPKLLRRLMKENARAE